MSNISDMFDMSLLSNMYDLSDMPNNYNKSNMSDMSITSNMCNMYNQNFGALRAPYSSSCLELLSRTMHLGLLNYVFNHLSFQLSNYLNI